MMPPAERFKLIQAVLRGEITAEEAVREMNIPEVVPLPLGESG